MARPRAVEQHQLALIVGLERSFTQAADRGDTTVTRLGERADRAGDVSHHLELLSRRGFIERRIHRKQIGVLGGEPRLFEARG